MCEDAFILNGKQIIKKINEESKRMRGQKETGIEQQFSDYKK